MASPAQNAVTHKSKEYLNKNLTPHDTYISCFNFRTIFSESEAEDLIKLSCLSSEDAA